MKKTKVTSLTIYPDLVTVPAVYIYFMATIRMILGCFFVLTNPLTHLFFLKNLFSSS